MKGRPGTAVGVKREGGVRKFQKKRGPEHRRIEERISLHARGAGKEGERRWERKMGT